jgi:hypothetical protein
MPMTGYYSIHLPHLLDEKGSLASLSGRGLRLALYWTEIVAQASNYDEPTTMRCRRRPGRRPCKGLLTIFFDVDTNDVLWFCPACDDQGRISGWEGTFWDNANLTEGTQV